MSKPFQPGTDTESKGNKMVGMVRAHWIVVALVLLAIYMVMKRK